MRYSYPIVCKFLYPQFCYLLYWNLCRLFSLFNSLTTWKNQKLYPSLSIQGMEGERPLVLPLVEIWGLTITSQYVFLSCLCSFMVWCSSVLGIEEPHQSIPAVKLYCGEDTVEEVNGCNQGRSSFSMHYLLCVMCSRCVKNGNTSLIAMDNSAWGHSLRRFILFFRYL